MVSIQAPTTPEWEDRAHHHGGKDGVDTGSPALPDDRYLAAQTDTAFATATIPSSTKRVKIETTHLKNKNKKCAECAGKKEEEEKNPSLIVSRFRDPLVHMRFHSSPGMPLLTTLLVPRIFIDSHRRLGFNQQRTLRATLRGTYRAAFCATKEMVQKHHQQVYNPPPAMSAWTANTRRAPSCIAYNARVYGHTYDYGHA